MSLFCLKMIKPLRGLRAVMLTLVVLCTTSGVNAQVFSTDLEGKDFANHWIGVQSIDTGLAFSGRQASVTKTGQPYGIGFEKKFPDEISGKNAWFVFQGRLFTQTNEAAPLFVLTLEEDGKSVFWHGFTLKPSKISANQWELVTDSLLIPASLTKSATIKAYLWNQTPERPVWFDDLEIGFRLHHNPTFLPEVPDLAVIGVSVTLYQNKFYSVNYDAENKVLSVNDPDGNQLVQSLQYVSLKEYSNAKHRADLLPELVKTKSTAKETRLVFSLDQNESKTRLVLICREGSPELRVEVTEKFLRRQQIERESLVFTSALPVSTVFKSNRKIDVYNFADEYWLNKQGVMFGNETGNWWIYHAPQVSSFQLDTDRNQLLVNLEYDQDHPFFRFPLAPDTTNWQIDVSKASRKRGQKQSSSFIINVNTGTKNLPRLMKNPAGYLATYIWSEHADWTNLATHRATYFGSGTITQAEEAVGGFVFYGIPVTKSVFYANPDSVTLTETTAGQFNDLEICIQTDADFLTFLQQISYRGSEICLHTPDHFTTTPAIFKESMAFMQNNFNTVSWIDHGNNNGLQNNREDLVCDATLKKSPFYALDIWEQFGVRYLHNSYYEDMASVDFWPFDGNINKPFHGFGDFWPKPDYWRHCSQTNDLIHWPTTSALFVEQDPLWDYYFSNQRLQQFVAQWEVKINHSYPAWADPKKGFWTYGKDSLLVAQPGFNQTLERMSFLRDRGDLNLTTVREFLDYNLALEQVDYAISPEGHLTISNNGPADLKNLALVTAADFVVVNGLKPRQKLTPDGCVFWFDLPAGTKAVVRFLWEE